MFWADVLTPIAIVLGTMTAVALVLFGLRLWSADNLSYLRNYERSKSLVDVVRGTINTTRDGTRDHATQAGLAVNKKNEWTEQGTLSEEAIDSVLSRG
jgi:hypothetical protein